MSNAIDTKAMSKEIHAAVYDFCLEQGINVRDGYGETFVGAFDVCVFVRSDGRLSITVHSGWGSKFVTELKKIAIAYVRAVYGIELSQMFHEKTRGHRVWCTYYSSGHHDGWAAGFKFPCSLILLEVA